MFFQKKRRQEPPEKPRGTPSPPGGGQAAENISVREVARAEQPVRRAFPGPRGAQSPLRVALDRSAYAELIAHAKESLSAEICGVLAGHACEDDEGVFVQVEAAIRGTAASEGNTHVTFTQATWSAIHEALERDHPKLKIVGWYHSHPGFGVEFSEMDLFIQRNFFSDPAQIALVTDPLTGAVAIGVNTPGGIEYLPRFWVDGREQPGQRPARPAGPASAAPLADDAAKKLEELEGRVSQLILALDEQRASLYRFLLFAGMSFCLALMLVAGYAIYLQLKARVEPPRNVGFAPVPVQIGEHTALLGVQVVSWQLPPELDAVQQAIEKFKRELERQAAELAGTNGPTAATNPPPASNAPTPTPSTQPPGATGALPGKPTE